MRLLGHVEILNEYRMARRVLMEDVSGVRLRGRPRLDWMDGVNSLGQQWDDGGGCAIMC